MSYTVALITSLAFAGLTAPVIGGHASITNPTSHEPVGQRIPQQYAIIREEEWRKRLRLLRQQAGGRFDDPPSKHKMPKRHAVVHRRTS